MKTMKKIVAIVAVALMLVSILPLSVFAADAETIKYTISSYPAGSQYKAETHKLDDYLTVITNTRCHFTSELRIYAPSGSVNGEVILASTREMTAVVLNAGNKASTLTVSTSPDNSTWTQHSTLSVASSYKDLSISNLPAGTKYVKLVNGSGQVRVKYITVSYAADVAPEEPEVPSTCEHKNAQYEHDCLPTVCPDCEEELPALADHSYNENVTLAPTCTTAGEKTLTCACGDVKTETVNALGHTYVDGFCSECGEAQPLEATITFDNLNKMTSSSSTQQVWKENGIVVTYDKNTYNSNLAEYANPIRFYAGTKITISYPGITKVEIVANNTSYASAVKNALSGSTVNGTIVTYECEAADSVSFVLTAQARVNSITVYGSAPSDCEHNYVSEETLAPTCTTEGVMTYTCSKCEDSYTEAIAVIAHNYVEDVIDATCTTTGTKTYECSVCGNSYDEVIPVKPHNYVNDVCADCGAVKAYKGTITFDNTDKRTEFTEDIQVWKENGITVTNNKGASTTDVANYSNPARFYKNSELIVEFPDMISLVFNTKEGASDLASAIGANAKANGNTVTVTFDEPQNSLSVNLTVGKVFVYSITAVVAHECTYDSVVTDPTCVSGGYTTNTCTKCGDSNVSDATEALDHTYAHEFDTTCDVCGAERAVVAPVIDVKLSISEDVNGLAFRFEADVAGFSILAGTFVQADYTNATYKGYKLIETGVTATNGVSETTIKGERMCDLDENGKAMFAYRIIDIPADKLATEITMTPYYIVEIDGVETTLYGEAVVGSYTAVAG